MTYIVAMQHANNGRNLTGSCAFVVDAYSESSAMIKASDEYRAHFGKPKRGHSCGVNWVSCDFFFGVTKPVIRLSTVSL